MAFVTHFESPDGEKLPIAASTLVTVEIPAAGSADKGDWHQAAQDTTAHYNQQAGHNAPKSSAVIPHCTDPSVFTDHGLRIDYEEQLQGWVLWIDSLPETACTLTLLFINHSTEGMPCVLPALGVGGGELPTFDLVEMGLPPIQTTVAAGAFDTEKLKAIRAALSKGAVRFVYQLGTADATFTSVAHASTMAGIDGHSVCMVGTEPNTGTPLFSVLNFTDQFIQFYYVVLAPKT